MTLEIRELTPALLDDYLAFFDHDAFPDNPWWSGCFCSYYQDPSHDGDSRADTIPVRRPKAIDLVRSGRQRGLLAYDGGKVVAWCNAAPRASYLAPRDYAKGFDGDSATVGSIMCFVVTPPRRNGGVATALLDAACERFRRLGLAVAEAYPPIVPPRPEVPSSAHNYHGPLAMYVKAGFRMHRELERFAVVRKDL